MTRQPTDLDTRRLVVGLLRQALVWGPIVVGVIHQFLMAFFEKDTIYVFVDPPGYIRPFVSLEWQWWFVLLIGSVLVGLMAYSGRFPGIPSRVAVLFYLYILFLLILVKPI